MSFAHSRKPNACRPGDGRGAPQVEDLVALARRIAKVRSARKELLPAAKLGEPGWDMILALYLANIRGERLTVSNVCAASDTPPTTAFRWLTRLIELDMVTRHNHPTDARVIYIHLQPVAAQLIEAFLFRAWSNFYSNP